MSYTMPNADAKQLAKLDLALEAAFEAGDKRAAIEVLKSQDYLRLLYLDERADAAGLDVAAYAATVGARATLAMKYVSLAALQRRALEQRIQALETSVPKYCGVYRSGTAYGNREIVTHSGSMWIAMRNTDTKPPSDDWTLCVQKGRDAR